MIIVWPYLLWPVRSASELLLNWCSDLIVFFSCTCVCTRMCMCIINIYIYVYKSRMNIEEKKNNKIK